MRRFHLPCYFVIALFRGLPNQLALPHGFVGEVLSATEVWLQVASLDEGTRRIAFSSEQSRRRLCKSSMSVARDWMSTRKP